MTFVLRLLTILLTLLLEQRILHHVSQSSSLVTMNVMCHVSRVTEQTRLGNVPPVVTSSGARVQLVADASILAAAASSNTWSMEPHTAVVYIVAARRMKIEWMSGEGKVKRGRSSLKSIVDNL